MRERLASVRFRTTATATLVVALALVIGATTVVLLQRESLIDGIEQNVMARAADVATLARDGSLPRALTSVREDDVFIQVIDARGRTVSASRNLAGETPILNRRPPTRGTALFTATVRALDGRFRIAARQSSTPTGAVSIYSGEALKSVSDTIHELIVALAVAIPALVALVAVVAWRVVGRALRPVERIRAQAETITDHDQLQRLPEPATRDEIARLAKTMNAMLARLESASDRERRFVSDAAHELQSPLATLRTQLEVELDEPPTVAWPRTGREALEEVMAMQRLVDDLLDLARADAGTVLANQEPVDLDDIALREVDRLRTRGRVTVDTHAISGGQVIGDPRQLQRAMRNLLDNAERYGAHRVAVALHEHAETVELTISDDGPGIPADDRERMFERFARLDPHRARDAGGTGLGLAITREIVHAHGGRIEIVDAIRGTTIRVTLPRAGW